MHLSSRQSYGLKFGTCLDRSVLLSYSLLRFRGEVDQFPASQAIRTAPQVKDLSVMQEAVKDCHHQSSVPNQLPPARQALVGGDHCRSLLVASGDDLIQDWSHLRIQR